MQDAEGEFFEKSHQVLEHQCERLVRVDDIVQRHDVGMFQVLQQRHWSKTEQDCSSLFTVKRVAGWPSIYNPPEVLGLC